MRYVHISQFNPLTTSGGVAQFGKHLAKAIPGLEFLWDNEAATNRPWLTAGALNRARLMENHLDSDITVIADGFFGLGLQGKVKRLITVCHSTYAGWLRDVLVNPHPELDNSLAWLAKAAEEQAIAYRESDCIVAVSESAREELWDFYGLDSVLIRNGVDVIDLTPDYSMVNASGVVEVAGNDYLKGRDIIERLREEGIKIDSLGFDGSMYDRWEHHAIALLPSRHEGGSYAQLEAMAMDKKIVAYQSGYFKDADVPQEYLWSTADFYWGTFNNLVKDALLCEDGKNPRQWVMKNATLDMFISNWRNLLGVEND